MRHEHQTSTDGMISRRTFVRAGGAFVATLALPAAAMARTRRRHARHHRLHKLTRHTSKPPAPKPASTPVAPIQLSPLRRSSYMSVMGQTFAVSGTAAGLQLLSVQDLNQNQAGSENAFALVLVDGSGNQSLAAGLPELSHSEFGTFPLMLVPGVSDVDGQHYEAVINRDD